ncbi:MAG: pilus assembly protein PilM [Chloroflexi bacterium]|nr:pilus assembly protein PilM [Chloroflexota bacterium]
MSKEIVTLYIDDISLRLLVTDGKEITKWAYLPLQSGLVEGGAVIQQEEVANRIKWFLKDQKIRAKKVIVGISGLHCFTRPMILPQLPKTLLDEAVTREAKRLLPLPPDQLYLTWHLIPAPKDKMQVFLAAVRRRSADSLFKALHMAGLNPYVLDLKPLALARLVKERTAIIVDVQQTEFDIVIMADGIPQPIRTVSFPREASSWEKKFPLIKTDLERTIEFYNSNNQGKPLPTDTPLYAVGELAGKPEMAVLSSALGFPVQSLIPPLDARQPGLDWSVVNIGLALKDSSLKKKNGPSVANANILPFPYRPTPISWRRLIAIPGAAALLGLLIPWVMLVQSISAEVASLRNEVETNNALLTQKQTKLDELRKSVAQLDKLVADAKLSGSSFSVALESLDRKRGVIARDLLTTMNTLPSSMSLTAITHTGSILTLSGVAPSDIEILAYARRLNLNNDFLDPFISSMKDAGDQGMTFTVILKVRGQL